MSEEQAEVLLELRVKRAVSKAVKREAAIELAFTAYAVDLAKKRNSTATHEELIAMGKRVRARMRASAPDRYLAMVQSIESEIDYQERAN